MGNLTVEDEISNNLLLLSEAGSWEDALDYLAEHWLRVRGTRNINLCSSIGQILISNGYPDFAKNWLFERSHFFPRNGHLVSLLIQAAADLNDNDSIIRFGEINEECDKGLINAKEDFLHALLASKDDHRYLEVHQRIASKSTIRGKLLHLQFLFYKDRNYEGVVQFFDSLTQECKNREDFCCHAALAYFKLDQIDAAIELIQPFIDLAYSNSCFTAFNILKNLEPNRALSYLNNSLEKYGYAPISTKWVKKGFSLSSLCFDPLEQIQDNRLVTIIMTVHKNNPMLKTAINSILSQTYRNIELLIIDDNSPIDDLNIIIDSVSHDSRVKIISQEFNSGTYSCRNLGLKNANGEFVLFVDSDDWTHPQRIEKSIRRLDAEPKSIVALESYVRMHEDGTLAIEGSFFVRKCMMGLWRTKIIRDELGGFDYVRISADSELLERAEIIYGKASINHVPVCVYFAYSHDDSLTGSEEYGYGWRGIVGQRAQYASAYRSWHKREKHALKSFHMMNDSQIGSPFPLPKKFHRTTKLIPSNSKIPDFLKLMNTDCTRNILSNFFAVPIKKEKKSKVKISVCLATYPGRFDTVGRTIQTLLDQTRKPDHIHVWVNESTIEPQLPKDSRIIVHLSPDNNLTDIGKFASASLADEGIIILADDDLNYPSDYIEYMSSEVERYDGNVCIGLHGVVFPLGMAIDDIDLYFSTRRVQHFRRGLSVHLPCHVLGTGTMAYDSRKIKFDYSRWTHNRMVDLHVGVECQRLGIGMVSIPRSNMWLTEFEQDEDDVSIWESVKKNKILQNQMIEVVTQVGDWHFILYDGTRITEQDLLQSVHTLTSSNSMNEEPISQNILDTYQVSKRWRQRGRMLYFDAVTRTVNFEMPLGWNIEDTHPDLFRLVHYLLTSPWEAGILHGWEPTRQPGWRPAISYSGGVDSHACLELMPKNTIIMYHERVGFESNLNHTNANVMLNTLEKCNRDVVRISSNHELIRTDHGKSPGFSTDLAVGSNAILLADYYGLNGIAFGMPLENSYLFHGHTGRNFLKSQYWKHHKSIFEKAGLELILPTAGLSEIINLRIVENSELGHLAQSCLRSNVIGEVCGECWKCFRKNSLRGEQVTLSKEVDTFLNKQPLKQAASTIFALQKIVLNNPSFLSQHSHLNSLLHMDLNWLLQFHPDSDAFVPEMMRPYYLNKLKSHANMMSIEERNIVENLKIYTQKEE